MRRAELPHAKQEFLKRLEGTRVAKSTELARRGFPDILTQIENWIENPQLRESIEKTVEQLLATISAVPSRAIGWDTIPYMIDWLQTAPRDSKIGEIVAGYFRKMLSTLLKYTSNMNYREKEINFLLQCWKKLYSFPEFRCVVEKQMDGVFGSIGGSEIEKTISFLKIVDDYPELRQIAVRHLIKSINSIKRREIFECGDSDEVEQWVCDFLTGKVLIPEEAIPIFVCLIR